MANRFLCWTNAIKNCDFLRFLFLKKTLKYFGSNYTLDHIIHIYQDTAIIVIFIILLHFADWLEKIVSCWMKNVLQWNYKIYLAKSSIKILVNESLSFVAKNKLISIQLRSS